MAAAACSAAARPSASLLSKTFNTIAVHAGCRASGSLSSDYSEIGRAARPAGAWFSRNENANICVENRVGMVYDSCPHVMRSHSAVSVEGSLLRKSASALATGAALLAVLAASVWAQLVQVDSTPA